MIFSLALVLLAGLALAKLCETAKLPGIVGMLAAGMVLGPYGLNLLHANLLTISADVRKIALVIILLKAGLSLAPASLKKVGRPALLMSFVPASFELAAVVCLAPWLLGLSLPEAALLGSVLAAVSPAVVVPRMTRLMEQELGTKKAIPQLILAGASMDDVFVIVLFSTFCSLVQGGRVSLWAFVAIPVSIALGGCGGWLCGMAMNKILPKCQNSGLGFTLLLGAGFALTGLEDSMPVPFSGLLAVMGMGLTLRGNSPALASGLAKSANSLWQGAQVLLFVLVGAAVNLRYAALAGAAAIVLLFGALAVRALGVLLCLAKTNLNKKERLFCVLAYLPKATVQAAIGGVPLAMGLACGELVLSVAVLAILITAPLGAFAIDKTANRLLG